MQVQSLDQGDRVTEHTHTSFSKIENGLRQRKKTIMSTGPITKVNINTREIMTVSRKLVCERWEETPIRIRREQRQRKRGTWQHHICEREIQRHRPSE